MALNARSKPDPSPSQAVKEKQGETTTNPGSPGLSSASVLSVTDAEELQTLLARLSQLLERTENPAR